MKPPPHGGGGTTRRFVRRAAAGPAAARNGGPHSPPRSPTAHRCNRERGESRPSEERDGSKGACRNRSRSCPGAVATGNGPAPASCSGSNCAPARPAFRSPDAPPPPWRARARPRRRAGRRRQAREKLGANRRAHHELIQSHGGDGPTSGWREFAIARRFWPAPSTRRSRNRPPARETSRCSDSLGWSRPRSLPGER